MKKISIRLAILIGIFSMLLIAIGSLGLFSLLQSNAALQGVHEDRTVPMDQMAGVRKRLLRNESVMDGATNPPLEEITQGRAEVEATSVENSKTWAAYLAPALTPEEEKIARDFAQARTKFLDEWMQLATAALRNNDVDTAKRLLQVASQVLGTADHNPGTGERESF